MTTVRVYDLPTRGIPLVFRRAFVGAYGIASLVDEESSRFAWHMLAGMALGERTGSGSLLSRSRPDDKATQVESVTRGRYTDEQEKIGERWLYTVDHA